MSISQNLPSLRPSLNLNFAGARKLDPRITFTRGSTGTYMDDNGLIKTAGINQARFDHSYDGSDITSLGLLVEESRTNFLRYSEDFTNAVWTLFGTASRSANTTVAPDGNTTADTVTLPVNSGIYQFFSASASTTYTFSVWIKANSTQNVNIVLNTNLLDPLESTVSVTTTWQRFSITKTTSVGTTTLTSQLSTGNGNTFFVWGAQVEAGAFPTSYIPTSGSTVTRSADNASITGTNFSDWFNGNEGTTLTSFKSNLNITTNVWSINNYPATTFGTPNNYIRLLLLSNTIHTQYNVGGTNSYPTFALASNNSQKVATSYKIDSTPINSAVNGTIGTGGSNIYASNPNFNQLEFGVNTDYRLTLGSYTIAQLLYYPKRLTNTQLQELTK